MKNGHGALWVTAVATGCVTVAAVLTVQSVLHQYRIRDVKNEVAKPHDVSKVPVYKSNSAKDEKPIPFDPDLLAEQLSRTRIFLNPEGLEKVQNAFVVVVGAGGVGSWVATMLLRSGVGHLRIIDFDQVTLSSLNRHAVATLADVGTSKVACMQRHLNEIAPWAVIETERDLWEIKQADRLLAGSPTYVVDAIDNVQTKVDLLDYCYKKSIPVMSSMGAGCKSDPTRVNVADISLTAEDPLSRTTRRLLRLRGIRTGIPVVFSSEKPDPRKARLMPLPDEEFARGRVDELSILPDFRARILPVLGPMPGVFGLAIATHILTTVAGYPTEYVQEKNRPSIYAKAVAELSAQNQRLFGQQSIPVTPEDAGYLIEEVFRGKSVASGLSTRLTISRWSLEGPLDTQNIVCMTRHEARKHTKEVLQDGNDHAKVWGDEVVERVKRRFAQESLFAVYR